MKRIKSRSLKVLIVICILVLLLGVCAMLTFFRVIHPNKVFSAGYEVRGVDVSAYQGDIDWGLLASQGIDFAYIKATEGSGYTDEYFPYNFKEAKKYGLRVGGYHFFSYDSPGKTQAENFISAVPKEQGSLPPVIDLEFYDEYEKKTTPERDKVLPELADLALMLEEHYGVRPVIYVTHKSYRLYIKGSEFEDYPLWIRDVYKPVISPSEWVFWQYADDEHLEGYSGDEDRIDMNVFNGSREEFLAFCERINRR